jgi:hypothetical protein
MDIIETLYGLMVGTAPMRALAAGVIAMLLVQAIKPWLAEQHYKPVAGGVAMVLCLVLELAVATPLTWQGLLLAAVAGLTGGLIAPGLYEYLKDMPGLKTLMKRV